MNIFVNLPTKDLPKIIEFWKKLGFSFNAQFTDETAAALVISENIYAMLLTHAKFAEFTKKQIVDTNVSTEVINALSMDSKEAVDSLLEKVIAAGGKEGQKQEYDFMYSRAFEDLDGHMWEVLWMDPNYVKKENI
jgi:hypothetical protein